MSEMAFGWTPYRFGFNNPVSVTDPLGLFESWDDARAFALISRMDNFSIERMGRYWSVWNYDLDATYSIVNGEFQVSRLLDLDITISGAGKPKTNPVPEGMRSFESLGDMPASFSNEKIIGVNTIFGVLGSGGDLTSLSNSSFRIMSGSNGSFSPRLYSSGWTGGSRARITTYSISKIGMSVSTGANVLLTGMAYYDIASGRQKPMTYVDAGVGTAGIVASYASYFHGVQIPVVGEFVAIYGACRLSWDFGRYMGAKYGPSKWYGTDDTKWFR